jgi:hypothetical protein
VSVHDPRDVVEVVRQRLAAGRIITHSEVRQLVDEIDRLRLALTPAASATPTGVVQGAVSSEMEAWAFSRRVWRER